MASLLKYVSAGAALAVIALSSSGADAAAMTTMMKTGASSMSKPGCQVTISVKTVRSESKPKGDIEAVLVTGALMGSNSGGVATADERCVYYYGPDVDQRSSTAGYTGQEWPYVRVADGCNVHLDSSVPSDSPLQQSGYVTVDASTRQLHIGGLPVYQYRDDEQGTCLCNEPPEWTSILPDGNGASFDVPKLN